MTGNVLLATVIFLPMLAGAAACIIGRKSDLLRDIFVIVMVAANFALCLFLALRFYGTELRLWEAGGIAFHFRVDGFRSLYGSVTAFLWLVTTLFSPEYFAHSKNKNRYWLFNLLTFGATMGVFFSADLRTTFLFFELMSFTSYALVAHDESDGSLRAAETFLAVAIIGGLAVLMGMIMLQVRVGTLEFAKLYEISRGMTDKSLFYLPGALMLVGFGGKAGMFPLHIWLPKAHPVAPAPASALLSGILTKTGVFGVGILSFTLFFNDFAWGAALLIPAAITMFLGAVLGVFSNDLKRTLACSSVSQIGFILTGIAIQVLLGDHNTLAARGTVLHMINHSMFKLVLFVAAGIVYINRHELSLDKIRGFGRGKPLFLFIFLMAALGITGFPFWSGYVSKVLLNEGIYAGIYLYKGLPIEGYLRFLEKLFNFTGLLTVAYMTKLFVALFIEKGEKTDEKKYVSEASYVSRPFAAALTVSALLIPVMGFFPSIIMDGMAAWGQGALYSDVPVYAVKYFSLEKIPGKVINFLIGAGIYIVIVRGLMMRRKDAAGAVSYVYANLWPQRLDLEDLIYRPLLSFLVESAGVIAAIVSSLPEAIANPLNTLMKTAPKPIRYGKILAWYYSLLNRCRQMVFKFRTTIQQRLRLEWSDPATIGDFSFNLLLIGIGLCIALVYVFAQAILK